MAEVTVTVHGTPAPQGSKTVYGRHVVESSKRVKPWREAVKEAALKAREDSGMPSPLTGPLILQADFYFTRPKKHYRTGRRAAELRGDAPEWHRQVPDLSKLIRSTEDAITDSGLWADDALVCTVHARKRWTDHTAGVLPGAIIRIREIWEQEP